VRTITPDAEQASKLLAALCDGLEGALRESAEGQRQHAEKRRARLDEEVAAARKRLNEVRGKLRQYRSATASISQHGGDARYAINNLRNQRQSFEQQVANYRARLKALQPSSSPLVAEWAGVVEIRQKQLEELKEQAAAGKATKEAVEAQERRVAEARAQLDAYRRTAAVESDQQRARSGEVASIEANLAQSESQLKNISEQLAKLEDPKTVEMLEEMPELQNEENRARNELSEAMGRADQLRRTIDAGGDVTVRVLDGKPDE
jgi:chromosome segregation ATPase